MSTIRNFEPEPGATAAEFLTLFRGAPYTPKVQIESLPASNGEDISMRQLASRILAAAVLAMVSWLLLAAATTPRILQPDKLIILSTTDVKGKTSPCG